MGKMGRYFKRPRLAFPQCPESAVAYAGLLRERKLAAMVVHSVSTSTILLVYSGFIAALWFVLFACLSEHSLLFFLLKVLKESTKPSLRFYDIFRVRPVWSISFGAFLR